MAFFLYSCGLDVRARGQRLGVQQHASFGYTDTVRCNPLGEWRRRLAVLGAVLPAMPRTCDAAIDDLAFTERPPLMGTDICDG
jgi:hypothetical protein